MSKKLEKNGLWESSRMMLPEHREAILEQNRTLKHLARPELAEQEQDEIARAIDISMSQAAPVTCVWFRKDGNQSLTGTVTKVDEINKRIRMKELVHGAEEQWITLADIVRIHLLQD